MALKLRAQRPRAQGGRAADKKAGRRGNAIPPYLGAPGSFKRLLGGPPASRNYVSRGHNRESVEVARGDSPCDRMEAQLGQSLIVTWYIARIRPKELRSGRTPREI